MSKFTTKSHAVSPFAVALTGPTYCPSTDALTGYYTERMPASYDRFEDALKFAELLPWAPEGSDMRIVVLDGTGATVVPDPEPLPEPSTDFLF